MPRTVSFDELPAWMQRDPHIQTGYRQELRNVVNCVLSLFYFHNEFVNTWSHLFPAIMYATALAKEARISISQPNNDTGNDIMAVRFYIVTTFLLFVLSVRRSGHKEVTPLI
jgi:adiponectin receptor